MQALEDLAGVVLVLAMMRCHQLITVVACMLPRASRGVRIAGMSVTPGWSAARTGGMRHLTMNEAAVEEVAVEDVPTDITAPLKSEFLQEMQWRGFIHQATNIEGLDEALVSRSVTAYLGFDATASSLHVGSLLQIMLLRHFQRCGHKPVVLVGGGTTKVGDPSGKDASRVMMTQEKIDENIRGISQVFEKFIKFGDGPTDALMVNNDDWLSGIEYLSFLREYGKYFTINRMLSFESVKQRLARESPLSFLEFNYMILQAYDFLELHRRHKAELQFGGSDQWGNIINGVELVRRRPPAPAPPPSPAPAPPPLHPHPLPLPCTAIANPHRQPPPPPRTATPTPQPEAASRATPGAQGRRRGALRLHGAAAHHLRRQEDGQDGRRRRVAQRRPAHAVRVLAVLAQHR